MRSLSAKTVDSEIRFRETSKAMGGDPIKKITFVFSVMICIFLLASCVKESPDLYLSTEVAALFDDCMSVEEVLNDVKNVETSHKYDLSGLLAEKSDDEENGITITDYYDKENKKIYTFYEGGENVFDRHISSPSGRILKVSYSLDDGAITVAECDEYRVIFNSADESPENISEPGYVCIRRLSGAPLPEELECWYESGKCADQYALWFDESGYHRFECWLDEDGKPQAHDEILYERISEAPETDSAMLTDEGVYVMPEFVVGAHSLFYTGDKTDAQWYLQADFVRTFDSAEEAESFRRRYSLEPTDTQGNEGEAFTQRTGELTVPIAKDCENFDWLMITGEINDRYYLSVSVNENGEIDLISAGIYSCY